MACLWRQEMAGSSGGSTILTSPDGVTWTSRDANVFHELSGINFGNGIFVAVGSGGGPNEVIDTSPDGINWTVRLLVAGTGTSLSRVAYGVGTFVAAGNAGTILQSGDTRLQLIQSQITHGAFTGTITNGVGQHSRIQTSTNLTTWMDILTNGSTPASWQFQDLPATNSQRHFYRAVAP